MKQLEKLYEIAEECLLNGRLDWDGFAREFETAYNARMALYRPGMATVAFDLRKTSEIIATNSPDMMKQYFEDKIYENGDLLKDPEIPFEPVRRTDSLTNEELRDLPFFDTFLVPHGIFHIMVVFAVLPDNSFLMLFVWRNETQQDFSEQEKLRLALFMRLLAKIVGSSEANIIPQTPSDIIDFGTKFSLTSSETDILAKLIDGHSLKAIAKQSSRSYGTVRWHVHNLLEKCSVNSQQTLLSEFYKLIKR